MSAPAARTAGRLVPVREAKARIGTGQRGLVYVLCFDRPYPMQRGGRAVLVRHYVGWASSRAYLRRRLAHHAAGRGARLLAAVAAAGITWKVVARFYGADRHFERYLHSRACTSSWCPRCHHTRRHVRRFAALLVSATTPEG